MSDVQEDPTQPALMPLEDLLEDGVLPAELRVRLTDEALAQALTLAAEPAHLGQPLRVYIEGKGCDGFYYGVSFDKTGPDDVAFDQGGLKIVVDPQSLRFLFGATVTWVDDERGRGFLVDNPSHKRFRGKFYKRKAWLTALTKDVSPPPSAR